MTGEGRSTASTTVLVVEDEAMIALELSDRLAELGYDVLPTALTCAAALDLLKEHEPDIALLDTMLGNDTCESVLNECERRGVKVLLCTAMGEGDLPSFCSGRAVLGKPFGDGDLCSALARLEPNPQSRGDAPHQGV